METGEQEGGLSFFSSRHASHDQAWSYPGISISVICVACLVETLETTDVLNIRKRKALREIVELLSRNDELLLELSTHIQVSLHLAKAILSLITTESHGLTELAIEGVLQLVCRLKSEELAREVIDKLDAQFHDVANVRKLHPSFVLLGKMLNSIPPLVHEINTTKGELVAYFLSHVAFPDENIQCALFYIFDLLCKDGAQGLDSNLVSMILKASCEALSSAKRQEVQTNALSVIRCLSRSNKVSLFPESVNVGTEVETLHKKKVLLLAKALKKVILSPDSALQLGSIQCISEILNKDNENQYYTETFLGTGIVEFLLETLESKTDLVLGSVFKCLIQFTNCAAFFDGSHSVYGVEPLINALARAVKLQNTDVIKTGFHLMTQIFHKQPRAVPVFPNKGIFSGFTAILQDTLNSMDYRILQQAVNTLDVMLLQNQIPRNVSSEMIESLLGCITPLLKRYHKPISAFRNAKSEDVEELLAALLSVIRSALILSRHIKQSVKSLDCILSGELQVDIESYLAQVIDQVCVPAVMVNYELITNLAIFENFFGILNEQFQNNAQTTTQFCKKLAEASFIRISMEVKNKCSGVLKTKLSNAVILFQQRLLFFLSAGERCEEGKINEVLDFISQVPSTPQDCLLMMTQCSMELHSGEVTDSSLFGLQCACLDLLYFSHVNGDKLVSDYALLSTLHKYILQHRGLDIPEEQSKRLVYLYAVSSQAVKCVSDSPRLKEFEESQSVVCEHLRELTVDKIEFYFYPKPEFLEWVFSSDAIAQLCGKHMLLQWISKTYKGELASNLEYYKEIFKLLISSTFCFSTFMSLVAEDVEVIGDVVEILERMLRDSESDESDSYIIPGSYAGIVADNLHKFFLKQKTLAVDERSCANLLKVAATLGEKLGRFDLRITQHTINLLTRTNCSSNVFLSAVNYLNVTIWQGLSNRSEDMDHTMASLLTNRLLIQKLNKIISNFSFTSESIIKDAADDEVVKSAVLLTTANLITTAFKTTSVTCEPFKLDLITAICFLNKQNNELLQISSMVFWSSIFTVRMDPNLVTFNKSIEVSDIQAIFIFLQNSLINVNELIKASAVKCLSYFLRYTHNPTQFISNPWNKVVLETLMLSFGYERSLSPSFVQLVSLFVKFNGSREHSFIGTVQTAVESITGRIPLLRPAFLSQALLSACIEFVQTIANDNKYSFTSAQNANLVTWLQRIIDAESLLDPEKGLTKYGYIDGILFGQDLFHLVAPTTDVGMLTELVASLSSNSQ